MPSRASPTGDAAFLGRTLGEKYTLEAVLGSGAVGVVYKAWHGGLKKHVAVKLLHRECAGDGHYLARFEREAHAASQLDHPNSVRVLDFGAEADGMPYIVMEYLEGGDLFGVIGAEWPLSTNRVVAILDQALSALAAAHDRGIVHRDIKPENLLVVKTRDEQGEEVDRVKVCDFGIAKFEATHLRAVPPESSRVRTRRLTSRGVAPGTPEYMSPEQLRCKDLDPRSDLYSLGVVLYQILANRVPFAGSSVEVAVKHLHDEPEPPSRHSPMIDLRLEAICLKALQKDPAERFQNAREMRAAVRELWAGSPSTELAWAKLRDDDATVPDDRRDSYTRSLEPTIPELPPRRPSIVLRLSRRLLAATVAGCLLLLVGGVGIFSSSRVVGPAANKRSSPSNASARGPVGKPSSPSTEAIGPTAPALLETAAATAVSDEPAPRAATAPAVPASPAVEPTVSLPPRPTASARTPAVRIAPRAAPPPAPIQSAPPKYRRTDW